MQYSLTVVRMVNGIADSSQKGRVAASVASLANAAGLPRLLVDLRHESTHNDLPSLPALQLAAVQALSWLATNYWQRQKDHVDLNKSKISSLIEEYVASHMAAATKAAAAAAEDDSSEEEGRDDGEDGIRGGGGNNSNSSEYNVAAARKQRQSLLTELRVAVPRPCCALLIEGLLTAQHTASQDAPAAVVARALTHAMKHLQEGWPQLPTVLMEAGAGQTSAAAVAADWRLWVQILVPETIGVAIAETTASSIIATAMASLTTMQQQQLGASLLFKKESRSRKNVESSPSQQHQKEALITLIEYLLRYVRSEDVAQWCRHCVATYFSDSFETEEESVPFGELTSSETMIAEVRRLRETLLQGGASPPPPPHRNGQGDRKRERNEDEKEDEERTQQRGGGGRWSVSKSWFDGCAAIGMLPSRANPNGTIPPLDISNSSFLASSSGRIIHRDGGSGVLQNEEEKEDEVDDGTSLENNDDDDHDEEEEGATPAAVPLPSKRCTPPSAALLSLI